MRKYRILLVVRHPIGGIRTFFRYFYTTIDHGKYDFTLLAPDLPETRILLEDLKDLDLKYVPFDRQIGNGRLFQKATRILLQGKFDLVHSHGFSSGVCSIGGALLTRTPHILTSHDVFTEKQFAGIKGSVKKLLLGLLLSMITCIHCVSNDARRNLLAYLWVLRLFTSRVVVIMNGVKVESLQASKPRDLRSELELPSDSFLIGFLGRFMSQKGFRYLVEALEILLASKDLPSRPMVLTFGDDGFIREERAAVERRGLADAVMFLPFTADAAGTLKGLDVVAMPSLWEACPLLPMEAMVVGVPLIGTNCIGLREVLENTPASVVGVRDSRALASALLSEIAHPSKARAKMFSSEASVRYEVSERAKEFERLMLRFLQQ